MQCCQAGVRVCLKTIHPNPWTQPHESQGDKEGHRHEFAVVLAVSSPSPSPSLSPTHSGINSEAERVRTTLIRLYTFVSETTVWRIVQSGEVGAEEENDLQVEKRCLGYRSQVRTDL